MHIAAESWSPCTERLSLSHTHKITRLFSGEDRCRTSDPLLSVCFLSVVKMSVDFPAQAKNVNNSMLSEWQDIVWLSYTQFNRRQKCMMSACMRPQRVNSLCRRWKKRNYYLHSSHMVLLSETHLTSADILTINQLSSMAIQFDYLNRERFIAPSKHFLSFYHHIDLLFCTLTCMRFTSLVTNFGHKRHHA